MVKQLQSLILLMQVESWGPERVAWGLFATYLGLVNTEWLLLHFRTLGRLFAQDLLMVSYLCEQTYIWKVVLFLWMESKASVLTQIVDSGCWSLGDLLGQELSRDAFVLWVWRLSSVFFGFSESPPPPNVLWLVHLHFIKCLIWLRPF